MTPEQIAVIDKMIERRQEQVKNCDRMLELLQPEWEKFEARTGHNLYVARDYADHTSHKRTASKELDALLAVRAILEEARND